MKILHVKYGAIVLVMLNLFIPLNLNYAFGDEPSSEQNQDSGERSRFVEERNPSAAIFDKRLPPVIPGEEISDGKDRMNVWSTSGDVTSHQPPSAPKPDEFQGDNRRIKPSIGVILDQRSLEHVHKDSK